MFGGNELRHVRAAVRRTHGAEAVAKQADVKLVKDGHYGTPYGPGPQFGDGGGDQYGYGPAYSYARQAPASPNTSYPQQ